MDDMPSRREVWLSMLAALGAGAVGGYWASSVRIEDMPSEPRLASGPVRPGAPFWEGTDPTRDGVRVLDVAHDLNCAACRRLRPALEALARATPNLAVRWRDWPTEGKESVGAAVALRAMALTDRPAALDLLHRTGAWEGAVTARRLRAAWQGPPSEAFLEEAVAAVSADVAWAEALRLRTLPSVLEGDRVLGVEAWPAETWRERLGLDG
jgi:hypothetical protein